MNPHRNDRCATSTCRALASTLLSLCALLAPAAALAQVTFNVAFDTSASSLTSTERTHITSHLQEAGRRWVAHLEVSGPRSIEILVLVDAIATANGASATTRYIGQFGGRDTYEQGVAYELRTGVDPNDDEPDARVSFGLDYLRNELWFDPDPAARTAPVPTDRTDAMSTLMHEFGHVLAYNGWADLDSGAPTQTYWSIWDSWIVPGSAPVFSGPAATAAWFSTTPALTIGNINHWGNAAPGKMAAPSALCGSGPVQLRHGVPVPRSCAVPHSADAPVRLPRDKVAGANLIEQLMNGVVFYRGQRYDISALDLGVLTDVRLLVDDVFRDGFESH